MAEFSDEGYLQIKTDPLQPRIGHLRDSLRSAIQRKEAEFPATEHPSEDKSIPNNGPDVETWKAVLDLIVAFQKTTPDRSIEPSFGGTPHTYSSASHQGSEQTKRLLDPVLKQQLHDCTYEHVDGFWEKYFEDKTWMDEGENIYTTMRSEHNGGRCTGIPSPPTEEAVWNWRSSMQGKHLQGSRGGYYTTASKRDLTGTDSERQRDILLKHRDVSSEGKHHWADVRVVGEHKASQANPSAKFFQLARYVRDGFTAQPTRRSVHGFLLLGSSMELYVFDRSGAYGATPFDVHNEPESFIRAISAYVLMNDEELGLYTFMEREGERQFVTVTEDGPRNRRRLELEARPIAVQAAIVSRGTCCYRTVDGKRVVKCSGRSDERLAEAEHLRNAQARGVEGVAELFGQDTVTTVANFREGLTFIKKRKFGADSRGTGLSSRSQSSMVHGLSISKRASDEGGGRPSKMSRSNSQASKLSQEYTANQGSQDTRDDQGTQRTQDTQGTQEATSFLGE